ncbi:MAG: pyridoxine 5'-phosphate synthase [Nitrospinae bacterium RIFCSPLOWO2_12_39_16]|nr:MAG: pyridoxine 5'-phosphate synthase [Nitrospinae bacterium RIFCSPLOWO2_02_39_17]OGW12755.1 MAG: pyridoxine 5'-phosphate synthase [Nitrospinae bacterium RIFCSPLOWO2_12_39_16]
MAKLCINVDHVATVREARKTTEPDPIAAAVLAELAGAHGITIHLREDRRHIQDRDLRIMREVVKTKLNLEMAATKEMIDIALSVKPDQVTFVPEKRQEITTEGGLDVILQENYIRRAIKTFKKADIPVSIFIDPDLKQIRTAKKIGADCVEINTGKYSEAKTEKESDVEFEKVKDAVKFAYKSKFIVHAGHGLTYKNVKRISDLKEISELNIGHNIIARAVLVGMERAVREMLNIMNQ